MGVFSGHVRERTDTGYNQSSGTASGVVSVSGATYSGYGYHQLTIGLLFDASTMR